MKWFSSDWHLGQESIIRLSDRPFSNTEEMDSTIIKNMIAPLKSGDVFYFLGDMGKDLDILRKFFDAFPRGVAFIWVMGNHDSTQTYNALRETGAFHGKNVISRDIAEIKIGKKIAGISRQIAIACHYPMLSWDKSHYNSWQLFGHHHKRSNGHKEITERTKGKQLNVCCEFHDFKPLSEIDIERLMSEKEDNWDYINTKKMQLTFMEELLK